MKRLLYFSMIALIVLIGLTCKSTTEPETPTETTLKITSPNGGENFMVGTSQVITWSSNTASSLKIEYTLNNGSTWLTLTSSTSNDGSFTWSPIPNTKSEQCKIKITTLDTLKLTDESDDLFKIVETNKKSLALLNPNGGEVLFVGKMFDVKWTSTGISNVKIEFSTNNGSTWNIITAGTVADSGKFEWSPIPNFPSIACLLKISDTGSDTLFDVSNSSFTITLAQTLKVTSPIGNEIWSSNSSQIITWYSQQVSDVKIEYTTNNGVEWATIAASTPSNGFYIWNPVPITNSTNAKVRISDAVDGYPSAESDTVFTITPQPNIVVISPNGGEYWLSGSSNYIKWTSAGGGNVPNGAIKKTNLKEGIKTFKSIKDLKVSFEDIANANLLHKTTISSSIKDVKIEFSSNNGATWNTISESTPNNGLYLWNSIPVINSALCKIRVSNAVDGNPADESDQSFVIYDQIPQDIVVTSPNGSEIWEAGTSQLIKWNSSGVTAVKIEYTTNNGVNWNAIAENTPSDGFYNWSQIPNFASTNCKVKISDVVDGSPMDESNAFFSISPEPEITVLTPNGGESFLTGTSNNITWTSTNIANVKIEYTINNGATWSVISESTPSDGVFEWANIPDINSSLCRVRISDSDDGVPFDISNNNFIIYNQIVQGIELTSPNGGEQWQAGTGQVITWSASGINNVKIEYTTNNGLEWNTIVGNVKSTGAYEWNVPNITSTQCKVRISDAIDGQPSDESNATFKIKPVPMIKVLKPNGGEVWTAGKIDTIKWVSIGVENVLIESSVDNGLTWQPVVKKTPSDGEYEASFTLASKFYKIKISDSELSSPIDESDGTFIVAEAPQITVITPNGGENWLTGTNSEIKWISTKIDSVKIEYTLNNGYDWIDITNSTVSNGIYNWQIPGSIRFRSDLCKIRVSNTRGDYSDVSDGLFSIHPQTKLLRLISPNGGDEIINNITENGTANITWVSAGISSVVISLSIDNGGNWLPITSSPILSTGAYRWEIPPLSVVSSLARIKIEDPGDPNFSDMSDSYFYLNIPKPGIRLLSPGDNSQKVSAGSNPTISWISSDKINSVKLEYSLDNGKSWLKIADNVTSKWKQINKYQWMNNQNLSGKVVIKVTDSDGIFSVKSKPFTIIK
ncbi:MAG: hypothetical protein NTX22_01390 [Ignavibacteriales bacterium]|nr:hypothetical protein [Ignavibacteriales bacterium]